jgi:hypothetical protein
VEIVSVRPVEPGGTKLPRTLARFDVQLTPDVCLRNLVLRRQGGGQLRAFAPNVRGGNVASFSPQLAARLAADALSFLEGKSPDDHYSRY